MKTAKYFLMVLSVLMAVWSCDEGIDPITPLAPGQDESAPVVKILYPQEGTQIRVLEEVTSVKIKFEVEDDIEIAEVILSLDGNQIASFSEFNDYRRFIEEFDYDQLTNGEHELTVTATDLSGKSTSESVSFSKASPYTPVYENELLYMPFDGDYVNLISLQSATVVGNPGFAGESVIQGEGANAYAGAADSYLTLPADGFHMEAFSAAFWLKVKAVPDRAGILVMGPPDTDHPDKQNNRKSGFRFFREAAGGMQRFKLNVGTGDSDAWVDGGTAADVDPTSNEWVHFAFTISQDKASVYIDGKLVKEGEIAGIDWTGCDLLSIMSGAPRFTGWDHLSARGYMDELRLFGRALSVDEIRDIIADESGKVVSGYEPKYDGEIFYMPFENEYVDKASARSATIIGNPGFDDNGLVGVAYKGAVESYLTFPTGGLLHDEFSASFWMNIKAEPNRAGVLVIGPPDLNNSEKQNNRTSGIRIFHEKVGEMQRFKLNVGTGEADVWVDGGDAADVDPASGDWVHFAATISGTEAALFINGVEVKREGIDALSWEGCDLMSIMSGAPRFTEWDHLSDEGLMDELRIFKKALSQEEIQQIIDDVE